MFCFYCECRPTQIQVNPSNRAGASRGNICIRAELSVSFGFQFRFGKTFICSL